MMIEVSSPPEYASTAFVTFGLEFMPVHSLSVEIP
jgi:hypothetical protein